MSDDWLSYALPDTGPKMGDGLYDALEKDLAHQHEMERASRDIESLTEAATQRFAAIIRAADARNMGVLAIDDGTELEAQMSDIVPAGEVWLSVNGKIVTDW